MVENKTNQDAWSASVSSSRIRRSISVRISTLIMGVLVAILVIVSFYGGIIYERSKVSRRSVATASQVNRHFALGLVVYSSPSSITIDNERTGKDQSFKISKKTLVSINGSKATASQIKAGDIVLLRYTNKDQAAVILVNSSFTD